MAERSERAVALTGACGFIGSHVLTALLARGQRVVGVDNFDAFYAKEHKLANLREALAAAEATAPGSSARFTLEEADITDARAMRRVFDAHRPQALVHLAAKAGVRPSIADPAGYMHANVTGTAVLLAAAHAVGCERLSLASSSSVYGNSCPVPFREDADVSQPISPYAASKRAMELLASTHHHLHRQPIACLRFFTVYGPRQRPDLAVALFLRKIAAGEPIDMFGDGSMARDFSYIDDIVRGVLASVDRIDRFGFRIWNLGNHRPIVLRDMIATIERTVGKPARIERKPQQPGDVDRTCADTTRAATELDYQTATRFEDGVARQWAWLQARG